MLKGDTVRKTWSGIAGTVIETSGDMVHVKFSDGDEWITKRQLKHTDRFRASQANDTAPGEPPFVVVDKVERRPMARFHIADEAVEYVNFKNRVRP